MKTIRVEALQDFEYEGEKHPRADVFELPRIKGLLLISQRKVKDAPIKIRFRKSYGAYNSGEMAGFPPDVATNLVLKKKVAEFESKYQNELGESFANPGAVDTNVDIKSLHWQKAVGVVNATSNLEQLETWLRTDTRRAVTDAIESRLGSLSGATTAPAVDPGETDFDDEIIG